MPDTKVIEDMKVVLGGLHRGMVKIKLGKKLTWPKKITAPLWFLKALVVRSVITQDFWEELVFTKFESYGKNCQVNYGKSRCQHNRKNCHG